MTTVQQIYSIRSFRTTRDTDFPKALRIYAAETHPQIKTDSREIAEWLDGKHRRDDEKFYVCGMYISAELVGFTEFIYFPKERLIQIDYFVIAQDRRTMGSFYALAEQLKGFFAAEKMDWDFITGEVAELDPIQGVSKYAQRLVRLFRHAGFSELQAEYFQPQLGAEHRDTGLRARLMILTRVPMQSISRDRYLEILRAIYFKHYGVWYSIYADTISRYQAMLEKLVTEAGDRLKNHEQIKLSNPERDFAEGEAQPMPSLRDAVFFAVKLVLGIVATVFVNVMLKHRTEWSFWAIGGATLGVFALLLVLISLTDKKRLEAFKLLTSLSGKFFD